MQSLDIFVCKYAIMSVVGIMPKSANMPMVAMEARWLGLDHSIWLLFSALFCVNNSFSIKGWPWKFQGVIHIAWKLP